MKWLPILRAETDSTHVFVKTNRGIEPAQKQYEFCNRAKTGDFALCKSQKGQLLMMDYSHEEVEA